MPAAFSKCFTVFRNYPAVVFLAALPSMTLQTPSGSLPVSIRKHSRAALSPNVPAFPPSSSGIWSKTFSFNASNSKFTKLFLCNQSQHGMKQYEYIELKNNTPCLSGIYFVLCLFHALLHCIYSVLAFFRGARRTHSFRTFLLQSFMKMLARLMLSFLSFMGVRKKAPFCCIKSPFLLYEKPLFYIQKGAFSIIMLREKNDDIKTGNDKMSLGNNPLQAKYACLR